MDKEQIIIHGVDVSGCKYHRKCILPDNIGCKIDDFLCYDKPNCYFKQSARKTQIINEIEEVIKPYQEPIELDALSLVGAIKSILERKTQECEELKERLVRTEEDLKYQCVDCMNCQSDRYRKALEEIEKVINNILNSCLGRNTVSCRPAHNVCGDLINILDIINKAKGSKNDR